ncbi:MAG: HK97 family phage prohead protease [Parasphingorhabdus sp.]|uniref:HK97 family phage prohead protease n=1 Tax=Parasphingorhabdus sp. TaxID=2709688 RepID=UPI003296A451
MTALRFAGYAAIFNHIDTGGDVIRPGAFGALGKGQTLPLLWQHQPNQRIGTINYAREDRRGLRVIGSLSADIEMGRKVAALVARGRLTGLSFGYRVERAAGNRPRQLLALHVAEISLVTAPMQPRAQVHAII